MRVCFFCPRALSPMAPHQRQEFGRRRLQGRPQIGIKVDDVLEVDAQLVGVLPEGVTVWGGRKTGERERDEREREGRAETSCLPCR